MFKISVQIPAKSLLFGEYSLLDGGKGLVCTFSPPFFDIEVLINEICGASPFVTVMSPYFRTGQMEFTLDADFNNPFPNEDNFFYGLLLPWSKELINKHITIKVKQSFSKDLGFGSSSALIAGLSYALYFFKHKQQLKLESEDLWEKIRASIKHTQGSGSGYDVGVQLAALISPNDSKEKLTFWEYQNQINHVVPIIKQINFEKNFIDNLGVFIRTNVYANTKQAVKVFTSLYNKSYFSERHKKIAEKFSENISMENLALCMQESFSIAKIQGIFDEKKTPIKNLVLDLIKNKIPFKTMGSGLGDCLWVLASREQIMKISSLNEADIVFSFQDFAKEKIQTKSQPGMNKLIPEKLLNLQEKLLQLRVSGALYLQNGDTGYASAPSNIALIKYWGKQKHAYQVPENSSVSLTLGSFRSFTKVDVVGRFFPMGETPEFIPPSSFKLKQNSEVMCEGVLVQKEIPEKINQFLKDLLFPYACDIGLNVESMNNFPTACGIASSASGFAALCAAVADLLQLEKHFTEEELQYWLYTWARLGSGSATRSALMGENLFVAWELQKGELCTTKPVPYHSAWKKVHHCVLVLNSSEKLISSSSGHKYAHTSFFHDVRKAYVENNYQTLLQGLEDYSFKEVGKISEQDALFMHSIMQTSTPPCVYFDKETAYVMSEFIKLRNVSNLNAFWTLDAGPNIHFIYEENEQEQMSLFFKNMALELKKDLPCYFNDFGHESVQLGKKEFFHLQELYKQKVKLFYWRNET